MMYGMKRYDVQNLLLSTKTTSMTGMIGPVEG